MMATIFFAAITLGMIGSFHCIGMCGPLAFSLPLSHDSDFAKFKGKKILIVNTASACGYTPQYEGLEALYKKYQDKLVIVGFPANNFGGQEPGTNGEIKEFCKKNYGVTFPMAAKISVKGDDMAAIYKWLCNKSENGVLDASISWNFNKFLLDEKGNLITKFDSKVTPMSDELVSRL